jgi:hypothetical protein
MTKLFILLNHDINDLQKQDADKNGIKDFIHLPSDLKKIWENLPPDMGKLDPLLKTIKQWLADMALPGDHVLIQGDFGACWLMVKFAFEHRLVPVYSTTERKAVEIRNADGTTQTVRQFKHVIFRKYGE